MKLDSADVSGHSYPRHSIPRTTDAKPLTQFQNSPSFTFKDSQMVQYTSGISGISTDVELSQHYPPASHTKLQEGQHVVSRHRQKSKVSNITPIPTALVTPLPGTSPPLPTHELRDHQSGSVWSEEVDSENESRVKESGWKGMRSGEHSRVSVGPLEQIEKWKTLVATKDEIMKQKSCLIDR